MAVAGGAGWVDGGQRGSGPPRSSNLDRAAWQRRRDRTGADRPLVVSRVVQVVGESFQEGVELTRLLEPLGEAQLGAHHPEVHGERVIVVGHGAPPPRSSARPYNGPNAKSCKSSNQAGYKARNHVG
eukprot:scaffold25153_cov68-Phaeocystis_antarctica.AAC.10